jgi:hypothetical protein
MQQQASWAREKNGSFADSSGVFTASTLSRVPSSLVQLVSAINTKYFSQPFPARTTIAAAVLPLGACVEIDLVVKA